VGAVMVSLIGFRPRFSHLVKNKTRARVVNDITMPKLAESQILILKEHEKHDSSVPAN